MPAIDSGRGDGYVWAEFGEFLVYSCYCSPNVGHDVFEKFVTDLAEDVQRRGKPAIIGGILT